MYYFDKNARLEIRLSSDDLLLIKAACEKLHISISKFIRELAVSYAKNYNKNNINSKL